MADAWTELSLDREAIALAKEHGWEDGKAGYVSMAYETAADYIREAYVKSYRAGLAEKREIERITQMGALAEEYGIEPEDDGTDDGKVAA